MALCVPLDLASKVNFKMMPAKYHIPALASKSSDNVCDQYLIGPTSFSSAQVNRGATVPCFETVLGVRWMPQQFVIQRHGPKIGHTAFDIVFWERKAGAVSLESLQAVIGAEVT
ncbi:hypothetical protein NOF04DRAFT_1401546 [Fusarium oxysporum II5]|nr:hypothetical protein NOF04DRAFT_1401546 [Fusarium oxysporum II5]